MFDRTDIQQTFKTFVNAHASKDANMTAYAKSALEKFEQRTPDGEFDLYYFIGQGFYTLFFDNFLNVNDDDLEDYFELAYCYLYKSINNDPLSEEALNRINVQLILLTHYINQKEFYFQRIVESLNAENFFIDLTLQNPIARAKKAYDILNCHLLFMNKHLLTNPDFNQLFLEHEKNFNSGYQFPPIQNFDETLITVFAERIHQIYFDHLSRLYK